ncbi:MAG: sulfite exporter TauE/SafE family protein [Candidatus Atelocyanobacterium thalassa]
MLDYILILSISGLLSGLLAGVLGIGGGAILVSLLLAFQNTPLQAVATSSVAIVIIAFSGSLQNRRMGNLSLQKVFLLGTPAIITAQIGVKIANYIPEYWLLLLFSILLTFNIFLYSYRRYLTKVIYKENNSVFIYHFLSLFTGGIGGLLAGLFGIGGGIIMVPLQILLLRETMQISIQNSLGVIFITSISSSIGHALNDNVLWLTGFILGCGGVLGVQMGTRILSKLSNRMITFGFHLVSIIISIYTFKQAWFSYLNFLKVN